MEEEIKKKIGQRQEIGLQYHYLLHDGFQLIFIVESSISNHMTKIYGYGPWGKRGIEMIQNLVTGVSSATMFNLRACFKHTLLYFEKALFRENIE
mgnify:CR=1 FL=1